MHRIDSATAEADKFGAGKDGFTEGTPGVTPATETTDDWFDGVQEEICNVIEGNGGTLVKGTRTQLRDIIRNLVGAAGGPGVKATGGSGNADGAEFIGTGTGAAVNATGGASGGSGVDTTGGAGGPGITATGGTGNTNGGEFIGTGTGAAVDATGADGPAVHAKGDTTSPLAPSLIIGAQDDVPSSITTEGSVAVVKTALRLADGSAYRKVPVLRGSQVATDEITATTADFSTQVTLPANILRAGDVVKIRATINSKTGTGSGSSTSVTISCGSTVISAGALTGIVTGDTWHFDCSLSVWTAGGPGTGARRGIRIFDPASGTTVVDVVSNVGTTPDTTVSNVVKITATVPSGDTLELEEFHVEV